MEFDCKQCGNCCRNANKIPLEQLEFFGLKLNKKGVCVNFKRNKCTIYNERPDICNIEKVYQKYFSYMNKEDFIKLNYKSCNKFKAL